MKHNHENSCLSLSLVDTHAMSTHKQSAAAAQGVDPNQLSITLSSDPPHLYKLAGVPRNFFFMKTFIQFGAPAVVTLLVAEFCSALISVYIPTLITLLSVLQMTSVNGGPPSIAPMAPIAPLAPLLVALIQGLATAASIKVLYRMVPGATGNCWFVIETFLFELLTVQTHGVQKMAESFRRQPPSKPIGRLNAMLTKCLWVCCIPIGCWTSRCKSVVAFGSKMILTFAAQLGGAVAGCYLATYSVPSGGNYGINAPTGEQVDQALDSDTLRATVLEGVFFFVFVFIFNRVHRSMPTGAMAFGSSGNEHHDVNLLAYVQFVATVSLFTISGSSLNAYVVWANSIHHKKAFQNVYSAVVGQFFGGVIGFGFCLKTFHIPAISLQSSLQQPDDPLVQFAVELEHTSPAADDDDDEDRETDALVPKKPPVVVQDRVGMNKGLYTMKHI